MGVIKRVIIEGRDADDEIVNLSDTLEAFRVIAPKTDRSNDRVKKIIQDILAITSEASGSALKEKMFKKIIQSLDQVESIDPFKGFEDLKVKATEFSLLAGVTILDKYLRLTHLELAEDFVIVLLIELAEQFCNDVSDQQILDDPKKLSFLCILLVEIYKDELYVLFVYSQTLSILLRNIFLQEIVSKVMETGTIDLSKYIATLEELTPFNTKIELEALNSRLHKSQSLKLISKEKRKEGYRSREAEEPRVQNVDYDSRTHQIISLIV